MSEWGAFDAVTCTCTLLQLYSVAVIDVSNNLCAEVFLSLQRPLYYVRFYKIITDDVQQLLLLCSSCVRFFLEVGILGIPT